MRTRSKIAVAALSGGLLAVLTGVLPASATNTGVTGELNCTGSNVYYSTLRAITATGNQVQLNVTDQAGSPQGLYVTSIGAIIVPSSGSQVTLTKQATSTQSPWAYLTSNQYLANTKFKLYGSMLVSDGPCDPNWGGTLYY